MKIIFHFPLPLESNAKSASGIRPQRMLAAFRSLGYEVHVVAGYASQRKAAIKKIRNNITNGVKYSFMYSETATIPTTLTEPHHLPTHPFMDWLFFKFIKKNNISIGLFYRDIYWAFPTYGNNLVRFKRILAKFAYYFDLWTYERTLKKLYLPSLNMGGYVPVVSKKKFFSLPPGHESPSIQIKNQSDNLKLFYVGGMSYNYKLHLLFEVIAIFPQIELTVCTRELEWLSVKDEYTEIASNINIIHESGEMMLKHLRECDIAVLYVKPDEYRSFASPFKLYEYLGFQKPILASSGTLAGDFVETEKIGWSVPYERSSLVDFFVSILLDKNDIYEKGMISSSVAPYHSWVARAQQVAEDLTCP